MFNPVASLASLLEVAAKRDPDGPAILDKGETITWSEAAYRSGQLAAALVQAGVVPGDRVGVHYRKSADSFLAMHAVVQQGAVAVPLDPTASASYLVSVIEQAECRVILTHPPCQASAVELAGDGRIQSILGIGPPTASDRGVFQSKGRAAPNNSFMSQSTIDMLEPIGPVLVDPTQPAYIITTSGSTGRPKGICHSHASALAYVAFKLEAYDIGPKDRVSDIAPNHFDISTLALWVSPFVGATNVVVPEQHQMFPASLAKLMDETKITVWYSVPYLLTQLLQRGGLDQLDLSAMRWVLFGGEVFPTQALADLMNIMPDARFSNVYGPAEVNACTIHHLEGPPSSNEPIPIGKPVADTRIRLVTPSDTQDSHRSIPDGEQGEVLVAGSTMMIGYWERPDLNEAAFVIDPQTGERWYRTGDLAFRDQAGDLVFAGRVDHQVKVRGHRVELESIESVLEDAEPIEYAVVTVARSEDGGDVLIAGLAVPSDGNDQSTTAASDRWGPKALRSLAADHLPAYAVPAQYYLLKTRPVTGSGKLDRRVLRLELAALHEAAGDPLSD